ncbi:hypothetical protein GCM10022402_06380 [Salinactinospora qingdaonensis]|uniref:Uncharacterized protein n=1 Tax=Salinactinospora qingdaonensis TaxID=702744 RepID=A0ABP7F0N2_9ACTN
MFAGRSQDRNAPSVAVGARVSAARQPVSHPTGADLRHTGTGPPSRWSIGDPRLHNLLGLWTPARAPLPGHPLVDVPGLPPRPGRDINAATNIGAAGRVTARHAGEAGGADVRRHGPSRPQPATKQETHPARGEIPSR